MNTGEATVGNEDYGGYLRQKHIIVTMCAYARTHARTHIHTQTHARARTFNHSFTIRPTSGMVKTIWWKIQVLSKHIYIYRIVLRAVLKEGEKS